MTIQIYLTYLLACIAITIIPGPTVTLIIANSLSHGTRAGLLNVAGTQLGLAMMLGVLLIGLSSIIATMGWWFDWVRIAGAVYVSCSGRGGPHFGAPGAELQIVRHALGDVPLVGFFAAGEIARHHLYGYTGVLTVFTSKD